VKLIFKKNKNSRKRFFFHLVAVQCVVVDLAVVEVVVEVAAAEVVVDGVAVAN
jgi:hypothetical protein